MTQKIHFKSFYGELIELKTFLFLFCLLVTEKKEQQFFNENTAGNINMHKMTQQFYIKAYFSQKNTNARYVLIFEILHTHNYINY